MKENPCNSIKDTMWSFLMDKGQKSIPDKRERQTVQDNYDGEYSHGYTAGWNMCIDELLKDGV